MSLGSAMRYLSELSAFLRRLVADDRDLLLMAGVNIGFCIADATTGKWDLLALHLAVAAFVLFCWDSAGRKVKERA